MCFSWASPFLVLQISAAVVEADVHLLGQSPLHNSAASLEKRQELLGVQNLQLLFLCQLFGTVYTQMSQYKGNWGKIHKKRCCLLIAYCWKDFSQLKLII